MGGGGIVVTLFTTCLGFAYSTGPYVSISFLVAQYPYYDKGTLFRVGCFIRQSITQQKGQWATKDFEGGQACHLLHLGTPRGNHPLLFSPVASLYLLPFYLNIAPGYPYKNPKQRPYLKRPPPNINLLPIFSGPYFCSPPKKKMGGCACKKP